MLHAGRARAASVVALLACLALGRATPLELSEETFNDAVKKHSRLLVVFTKPTSCSICRAVTPNFEVAAGKLKEEDRKTVIAVVNADIWKGVTRQFRFEGYPVVHYYLRGEKAKEYLGSFVWMLSPDTIKDWILQRESILDTSRITERELTDLGPGMKADEIAIEARVKKKSVRQKTVWQVMETLANIDVLKPKLVVQWLPKNADPKQDTRLRVWRMMFPKADDEAVTYTGAWSHKQILEWVMKHSYPTVGEEFSAFRYDHHALRETGYDASVVAVTDEETVEAMGNLRGLAPMYPKWRFAVDSIGKLKEKKTEMDLLGITHEKFEPSIFVLQGKLRYMLEGRGRIREESVVAEFLSNVWKGLVRPGYLSEPDPDTERDADGCLRLTGKNFPAHAFDPDKDVFVLFTANSTCEPCEALEPEWRKLARRLAKGREVVLGRMEARRNECEEEVTGRDIPKLVLYPAVAAKKKMAKRQVYRGQWRVDHMLDFLTENCRHLENQEL